MSYLYTDGAKTVLETSREEATRLRHGFVGGEHILLALVNTRSEEPASRILSSCHVAAEAVRERINQIVRPGKDSLGLDELPYTTRAKRALEYSGVEAEYLNEAYVGTDHLLIGLLRDPTGVAAQVLNVSGLTLDQARAEMMKLRGFTGAESAEKKSP